MAVTHFYKMTTVFNSNKHGLISLSLYLQEKEKEIEVKNIYANRLLRPPHHLHSSVSSTPAPSLALRERKNSEPDMTPRDKAKVFEAKRRDQERKKKEVF